MGEWRWGDSGAVLRMAFGCWSICMDVCLTLWNGRDVFMVIYAGIALLRD
jgi:hypothetical protein